MGYPIEIPNAMQTQKPVPVQDPVTRLLHAMLDRWRSWRRHWHRKSTRADHPERYQQGVDRQWPRIQPGDSRSFDFAKMEEHGRE